MSTLAFFIAEQLNSGLSQPTSHSSASWRLVIALTAAVLGLVVLIFIRTCARKATKR